MNDRRLWLKGFASGVSRLNSHSVIVCCVLRRLRILNRLQLHGCNARRKPGFFGPLAMAASDPLPAELRQFRHCFQAALNGVKTDWRHWLGKGPGLTPSHDDTLSGMLLAALVLWRFRCALWSPVFCLFRQSSTRYHSGERQLFTLRRARIFRLATPALCSCSELPETYRCCD